MLHYSYISSALFQVQHLNPEHVDDVTISPSECAISRSSNASSPASNSPSVGGVVGGGGGADGQDDAGGGLESAASSSKRESGHVGGSGNRNWWPNDVTRAKGVVHLNLSVAHVIRGESDKARLNLDKAEELFRGGGGGGAGGGAGGTASASLPAHFLQARIYLDLLEGDRDRMQAMLKAHFGHVTGNAHAPEAQTHLLNIKWG